MSFQSESDIFSDMREENQRLYEDLSFEQNLNNILENIRNNSLILIENCKCFANIKTIKVIKHLNTIYTDLKTNQNISKLNQKFEIHIKPIETNDENEDHLGSIPPKAKSDDSLKKVLRSSGKKRPISKGLNNSNKRLKTIALKSNLKSKYSLVTQMLEINDKSDENNDNSDTEEEEVCFEETSKQIEIIDCPPNSVPELYLSPGPSYVTPEDNSASEELTGYSIDPSIECNEKQEFECNVCHKIFVEKIKLLNHLWKVHKIQAFICDSCGYRTFSIYHLNRHKTTHSSAKPFKCANGCDKWFKTKEHLYEHKKLKHSDKTPFQCHICDFKTSRRAAFNYHSNQHSRQEPDPDRPFKCPVVGCNKAFKRQIFLESHKKQTHQRGSRHQDIHSNDKSNNILNTYLMI